MRHIIATTAIIVIVLGIVFPAVAAETVTVRGVVLGVHPWRAEPDGPVIFNVILKGEGPWRAELAARPEAGKTYAAVGALRRGDKITAECTEDAVRYWITSVEKTGHVELPPPRHPEEAERRERMRDEIERRIREEMEARERGERRRPRDDRAEDDAGPDDR